jgi:hypothetical protein
VTASGCEKDGGADLDLSRGSTGLRFFALPSWHGLQESLSLGSSRWRDWTEKLTELNSCVPYVAGSVSGFKSGSVDININGLKNIPIKTVIGTDDNAID